MPNTSASGGYLLPSNSVIDDQQLDAVFQQLMVGITGLDGSLVRPRWQPNPPKMPEPGVNWIAIGVNSDTQDENPSFQHIPGANSGLGQDELSRQESIEVLATFYGANAKQYAKLARDGLYVHQNREAIYSLGIVFIECQRIIAAPELINEQWYKRYDMTIVFRRTVTREYQVQNILTSGIDLNNENYITHIEVDNG